MNKMTWLKSASAALLAAMLAACGGGGGGTTSTPLPEVAWASPAVFVTPGASSKSFALTDCTRQTQVSGYYYSPIGQSFNDRTTIDLSTASMVIGSNGDVSFKAAITTTGVVNALWSMAFDEAENSGWAVSGTTQTPSYSLTGYQDTREGDKSYSVYSNAEESEAYFFTYSYVSSNIGYTYTYVTYSCDLTDQLALQVNADKARAAKNLGTAAGVTTYDDYYAAGRIEGGKAFWVNTMGDDEYYGYQLPQYTNLRFDLATGDLASSATAGGTYTAVNLGLPSAANTYGEYGENLERGSSFFGYKDAKTICIAFVPNTATEEGFFASLVAYGTRLMPNGDGRRVGIGSFESPKAGGGSRCAEFDT